MACTLFTVLEAKDRKVVLKSLKDNVKEMITNRVASLFLVHIINTLDDTLLTKKRITTVSRQPDKIQEIVKNMEELF